MHLREGAAAFSRCRLFCGSTQESQNHVKCYIPVYRRYQNHQPCTTVNVLILERKRLFTFHDDVQGQIVRPRTVGTLAGVLAAILRCQTGQVERNSVVPRLKREPGLAAALQAPFVHVKQAALLPLPSRSSDLARHKHGHVGCFVPAER